MAGNGQSTEKWTRICLIRDIYWSMTHCGRFVKTYQTSLRMNKEPRPVSDFSSSMLCIWRYLCFEPIFSVAMRCYVLWLHHWQALSKKHSCRPSLRIETIPLFFIFDKWASFLCSLPFFFFFLSFSELCVSDGYQLWAVDMLTDHNNAQVHHYPLLSASLPSQASSSPMASSGPGLHRPTARVVQQATQTGCRASVAAKKP